MKKLKISKEIKKAIEYNVEHDILPMVEREIGDFVGHYLGKLDDVNFENTKQAEEACNDIYDIFVKTIVKRLGGRRYS